MALRTTKSDPYSSQLDLLSKKELKAYTAPLSLKNPSGPSLRYDPLYDAIQTARKHEESLPQGVWKHERKVADWAQVSVLCQAALQKRTKDLQLAAWLIEAWLHLYGFDGLRQGLTLLNALILKFWDSIHPYSTTDPEYRLAPLAWLDRALLKPLIQQPITVLKQTACNTDDLQNYTYWDYQSKVLKHAAIPAPESKKNNDLFYKAVEETPTEVYEALVHSLQDSLTTIKAVETYVAKAYPEFPGILMHLRQQIEQIHHFCKRTLKEKQEKQPQKLPPQKPPQGATVPALQEETQPLIDTPALDNQSSEMDKIPLQSRAIQSGMTSFEKRTQAYERLRQLAQELEVLEPHSLTPALIRRALAWEGKTLSDIIKEITQKGGSVENVIALLYNDDTP